MAHAHAERQFPCSYYHWPLKIGLAREIRHGGRADCFQHVFRPSTQHGDIAITCSQVGPFWRKVHGRRPMSCDSRWTRCLIYSVPTCVRCMLVGFKRHRAPVLTPKTPKTPTTPRTHVTSRGICHLTPPQMRSSAFYYCYLGWRPIYHSNVRTFRCLSLRRLTRQCAGWQAGGVAANRSSPLLTAETRPSRNMTWHIPGLDSLPPWATYYGVDGC